MPADRFYLKKIFKEGNEVILEGDELHHLSRVMRKKQGETVELVNGMGTLAQGKVLKIEKREATLSILEKTSHPPLISPLILIQALPKFSHLELIVQKGTELGVSSFHLFPSKQSEKKALSPHQIKRLEQICIGAMKQCGRLDLPDIYLAQNMESLELPNGHAYFGNPRATHPFPTGHAPYLLFIGPEKGFTDKEHQALKKLFQAQEVRLHPYILRVETAAIAAVTLASQ